MNYANSKSKMTAKKESGITRNFNEKFVFYILMIETRAGGGRMALRREFFVYGKPTATLVLDERSAMELNITTPALLFPAISLLLLAYTNRFLALAALIRDLKVQYQRQPDPRIITQIESLRSRVYLIRDMQGFGIVSLLCCVIAMFLLFVGSTTAAQVMFGGSLVLMAVSLIFTIREIKISVDALNVHLKDIEQDTVA